MRLLATFLVLLPLTLAHASSDGPPRIGEDGFSLPLSADGAEVHIADRALVQRNSRPDARVIDVAQVRFADWGFAVSLVGQTLILGAASAELLDEYVSGAEGGAGGLCTQAHAHGDAGKRWNVVTVADATALRFWIDCTAKQPGGVDRVLSYVVLQPGRELLVSFVGDAKHVGELDRTAQHMLEGAQVQRYHPRGFGRPHAYQIGYRVGRVLGPLLMLGLLALVVVRVARKRA
jgi:hypothetical protein